VRRVDVSARVVTQVEDDRLHVVVLDELAQLLVEIGRGS
jgi:hypothetical protein